MSKLRKEKSKSKLICSENYSKLLENRFLLLDTNILLGLSSSRAAYNELLQIFEDNENTLVTIDLCVDEFFKGSDSFEIYTHKQKFLDELNITILETKIDRIQKQYEEVILKMKRNSARKSLADLYLTATLLSYADRSHSEILLVTEDISDFEAEFFNREIIFTVNEGERLKNMLFCKPNAYLLS